MIRVARLRAAFPNEQSREAPTRDGLVQPLADAAALSGLLVFLHPLLLPFSSDSLAAALLYAGLGLVAAGSIRATSRLDAQGGIALTFTALAGVAALIVTADFGVLLLPSFAVWFATTARLIRPGDPARVARLALAGTLASSAAFLLVALVLV